MTFFHCQIPLCYKLLREKKCHQKHVKGRDFIFQCEGKLAWNGLQIRQLCFHWKVYSFTIFFPHRQSVFPTENYILPSECFNMSQVLWRERGQFCILSHVYLLQLTFRFGYHYSLAIHRDIHYFPQQSGTQGGREKVPLPHWCCPRRQDRSGSFGVSCLPSAPSPHWNSAGHFSTSQSSSRLQTWLLSVPAAGVRAPTSPDGTSNSSRNEDGF